MRNWLRNLFEHEVEFFLLCLCNILVSFPDLLNLMLPWGMKIFSIVFIVISLFFMVMVVFFESLFWGRAALYLSALLMLLFAVSSLLSVGFVGSLGALTSTGGLWWLAHNVSSLAGGLFILAIIYRTCLSLEAKKGR